MVQISTLFAASAVLSGLASAMPVQKRIAQVIADATADWEQACLAAGGAQQCNPISQIAFGSLLAAEMIDLAKTLKSDPEMIRLTQLFVQQPRNAPDSLQVPYCQTAPKNAELNGLFHCQFASSNFAKFSGDQTGNVPLGLTAVSPPGSCPAKTDGPVPDGVQLNTLVSSPGVIGGASTAASAPPAAVNNVGSVTTTAAAAPPAVTTAAAAAPPVVVSTSSFALQNGKDAQALNAKFATLTTSSSCTAGENACINGQFAQCVGSSFVVTGCAGGTQCFALPLVNSAGTSITCSTAADATSRIANTGATGGITGA